jgi:hypothetical protein
MTYPYRSRALTWWLAPAVGLALLVLGTDLVHAARPAAPPVTAMGPRRTAALPAYSGTFDGHTVLYLLLDTSDRAEALRGHLDYSPRLALALPAANEMYLVMNGAFTGRGPIFAFAPAEAGYTPLTREVLVRWKAPTAAVALTSDEQIVRLVRAGKLIMTSTHRVVNSPIIKVMDDETGGESGQD